MTWESIKEVTQDELDGIENDLNSHIDNKSNPHSLSSSDVGAVTDSEFSSHTSSSSSHHSRYSDSEARNAVVLDDVISGTKQDEETGSFTDYTGERILLATLDSSVVIKEVEVYLVDSYGDPDRGKYFELQIDDEKVLESQSSDGVGYSGEKYLTGEYYVPDSNIQLYMPEQPHNSDYTYKWGIRVTNWY